MDEQTQTRGRKLAFQPTLGNRLSDITNSAIDKIQQGKDEITQTKNQLTPPQQNRINQTFQIAAPKVNSLVPDSDNVDEETQKENEDRQKKYAELLSAVEKQESDDNWLNAFPNMKSDLGLDYRSLYRSADDYRYDIEDRAREQIYRDAGFNPEDAPKVNRPDKDRLESNFMRAFMNTSKESPNRPTATGDNNIGDAPQNQIDRINRPSQGSQDGNEYAWQDAKSLYDKYRETHPDISVDTVGKSDDLGSDAAYLGLGLAEALETGVSLFNSRSINADNTAEYEREVRGKKFNDKGFDDGYNEYLEKLSLGMAPHGEGIDESDYVVHYLNRDEQDMIGDRDYQGYNRYFTVNNYPDPFEYMEASEVIDELYEMLANGSASIDDEGNYIINGINVGPDIVIQQNDEELPKGEDLNNADWYQVYDNLILPEATLRYSELDEAAKAEPVQSNMGFLGFNNANPEIFDENFRFSPDFKIEEDLLPVLWDAFVPQIPRMVGKLWFPITLAETALAATGVDPRTYDWTDGTYAAMNPDMRIDQYAGNIIANALGTPLERKFGQMFDKHGDRLELPLRERLLLGALNGARGLMHKAPKESLGRFGRGAAGAISEGLEEVLAGPLEEFGSKGLNMYAYPERLSDNEIAYDPSTGMIIYSYDTPFLDRVGNAGWSSIDNFALGAVGGGILNTSSEIAGAGLDKWNDFRTGRRQNRLDNEYNAMVEEATRKAMSHIKPGDQAALDAYKEEVKKEAAKKGNK